jgi:ammonium transporter, Amt family
MIATGVFARDVGLVAGRVDTLLLHVGALAFVSAFTFGMSWLLYRLTDLIIPLRVSREQEALGLDQSQHGESVTAGYPSPEMHAA